MARTLVVNKNRKIMNIVVFLVLVLVCIPTNEAYANLDPLLRAFRYIGLMAAFLLFFVLRIFENRRLITFFLFAIWTLIASAINLTDVIEAVKMIYPIFTCVVLTQYYVEQEGEKSVTNIAIFFAILCIINAFIAAFDLFGNIYTGGWQGNYLFGIRVNVSFILPYAVGLNLINARIDGKRGKFFCVATILSLVYFAIFEWVSTAIVTLALIFVSLFFLNIYHHNRKMLKTTIIGFILFCVGFVFLMSKMHLFEWFLVGVLNEDVTLDNRTLLWEQAFDYLHGLNWIYGFGFKHGYHFVVSWWFDADHPHNEYLETLFCYGMIGLFIYVRMIILQFKHIWRITDVKVRNVLISMLLGACLMHTVSHNNMAVFPYITFVIVMNSDNIWREKLIKDTGKSNE